MAATIDLTKDDWNWLIILNWLTYLYEGRIQIVSLDCNSGGMTLRGTEDDVEQFKVISDKLFNEVYKE